MRSVRLIALVLIAGCARSGADLFKKMPPPDASSDAFVVPPPDASVPDASPDAMAVDAGPPDAPPDAN